MEMKLLDQKEETNHELKEHEGKMAYKNWKMVRIRPTKVDEQVSRKI